VSLVSTIYERAIESAIKLTSWIRRYAAKYGQSFRSRTRSFPELMEGSGLLPTCTFFYAKATEEVYGKVCQLIDGRKIEPVDIKDEEFGYAAFLHGVLGFLEALGLIRDHKNPVEAIKDLNETGRLTLARGLLLPYIIEVKKLSEALFQGERE
jgi:CRISPR type III-B/RAMP module-associated protein Cmr5